MRCGVEVGCAWMWGECWVWCVGCVGCVGLRCSPRPRAMYEQAKAFFIRTLCPTTSLAPRCPTTSLDTPLLAIHAHAAAGHVDRSASGLDEERRRGSLDVVHNESGGSWVVVDLPRCSHMLPQVSPRIPLLSYAFSSLTAILKSLATYPSTHPSIHISKSIINYTCSANMDGWIP